MWEVPERCREPHFQRCHQIFRRVLTRGLWGVGGRVVFKSKRMTLGLGYVEEDLLLGPRDTWGIEKHRVKIVNCMILN